MNRVSEEQLKEAINGFQFEGNLISIKPYGSGHINDTYLLTYEIGKMGSIRVILQRVNQEIFTNPVELMQNIEGVTTYLKKIIKKNGGEYLSVSVASNIEKERSLSIGIVCDNRFSQIMINQKGESF